MRYVCIRSGFSNKVAGLSRPEEGWGPIERENRRGRYALDSGGEATRGLNEAKKKQKNDERLDRGKENQGFHLISTDAESPDSS